LLNYIIYYLSYKFYISDQKGYRFHAKGQKGKRENGKMEKGKKGKWIKGHNLKDNQKVNRPQFEGQKCIIKEVTWHLCFLEEACECRASQPQELSNVPTGLERCLHT
jgi:hypothetical protein